MEELKKENLSNMIVRALGRYILERNLGPGDRFPTEKELSENFHVGRNVVREALKALEVMGLVVSRAGIGTVLTDKGVEPTLLPFLFGFVLDDTAFERFCEIRLIMEQGAARLAARNATNEELNDLRECAKDVDKQKEKTYLDPTSVNQQSLCKAEVCFHQKLVELSHNPILMKFGALWEVFFTHVHISGDLTLASKAGQEQRVPKVSHDEIAQAIMDRDENKASDSIQKHLTFWFERYRNLSREALINLVS